MSKRARPRSTREQGIKLSKKESGLQDEQGMMDDLEKALPPPPGFAPLSSPTVCHRYGTRHAKTSLFESCVANAPLKSSSSTLKRARRILPESEEIIAASENLSLDVKQQTEASDLLTVFCKPADHVTDIHPARSSTAVRPENESNQNASHPTRSDNLNLTEILLLACSDNEEVNSTADPLLVKVDGYRVKAETAPLLEKIFARYGDIVKESTFQSVEYRSSFLEGVCSIYQRLEAINLLDISSGELKSMLNLVNDLELAKVEIRWLRRRLEEIYEAKELMRGASSLKETEMRTRQEFEEKKKALAVTKQEYDAYAEACQILHERIKRLEDEVGTTNTKIEKISESYSDTKAKVKRFYQHPLVRGLL